MCMIKASDLKENKVNGFEVLVDFGRIFIKAKETEDTDALSVLMTLQEVDHRIMGRTIVVQSDRSLRQVTRCFNEVVWAKAPRKIYTPIPFGGTGEDEKGYGVDFIQGRK